MPYRSYVVLAAAPAEVRPTRRIGSPQDAVDDLDAGAIESARRAVERTRGREHQPVHAGMEQLAVIGQASAVRARGTFRK